MLELATNPGQREAEEPRQNSHFSASQTSPPAAGGAPFADTRSIHGVCGLCSCVGSLGFRSVLGFGQEEALDSEHCVSSSEKGALIPLWAGLPQRWTSGRHRPLVTCSGAPFLDGNPVKSFLLLYSLCFAGGFDHFVYLHHPPS